MEWFRPVAGVGGGATAVAGEAAGVWATPAGASLGLAPGGGASREAGEREVAAGLAGTGPSGRSEAVGCGPGGGEGTGVAGGQGERMLAGRAGGAAGGSGSGEGSRAVRVRGPKSDVHTRWSLITMNVDGGDMEELGRGLAETAGKGDIHGGVVLLQDVRLEGRCAAGSVHEGLERLTGLKGELAPGPRAKDGQGKREK